MALDAETLADFREIMEDNLSDLADIYRKNPSDLNTVSDGAGGIVYDVDNLDDGTDERILALEDVPCRVVVPRANRDNSEYEVHSTTVAESRAVVVFAHDADVQQGDRVDVTLNTVLKQYEVQVIAYHSESYSLQCNCVEIKVQKT